MRHQYYSIVTAFFDCYDLKNARSCLNRFIKTADSGKSWLGNSASDVLHFAEKLEGLIEASFGMVNFLEYKPEVILDKDIDDDVWSLASYDIYCGWHPNNTPWHFFPRFLSKKEFLDPYRALEKFTRHRNVDMWKAIIKDLQFHALSPNYIDELEDGKSFLRTYILLHKLIEATHLIEVRSDDEKNRNRRLKWKDRKELEEKSTNHKSETNVIASEEKQNQQ